MQVEGLGEGGVRADVWTEELELAGAEAVAHHADGPARGRPAVTRREVGDGVAWYVATRLDARGHRPPRRTPRGRGSGWTCCRGPAPTSR